MYFVTDSLRENVFARKYPKATKRSFTAEDRRTAPDWFSGGHIIVAEYWTREEKDAGDGEKLYKLTQRITNGVEILEEHDWIGSRIPIIGVFGKEMWVKEGGQSKLLISSMIHRGLPAQQMMAYIASQEAEEFGMAPRSPFVGYKGTFVNAEKTWKVINKIPLAFVEVDLPKDWPPGNAPPPLPSRPQLEPNPQAYEISYERWRRSHQAAVAGTPLPTDAQKVNDKSGVALERIENAGMLGNLHFADNFSWSLANCGEQINELITKLAESNSLPKRVLGKNQKGEDQLLHVVGSDFVPPESSEHLPEAEYFFAHRGKYTVTISEGPHYQSQREEASSLADLLIKEIPALGLPPEITSKILSIAIRMKNIGVLGDELAELLAPPDPNNIPPQAKAVLAQAQGAVQQLQIQVQELMREREGKVIQGQFQVWKAQIDAETKKVVAEITTKAQVLSERVQALEELQAQMHGQAHEVALSAQEHSQAQDLARQQAEHAQQQAVTQAALTPPNGNQV